MTPSEKKAREIERTLDLYYAETDEDVMKGNQAKASRIDAIASALSEAERRGFERAKELAVSLILNDGYAITFQTMGQYRTAIAKNVRSLTHDEA